MNDMSLYRASLSVVVLFIAVLVTACASTDRQTAPEADDPHVTQTEPNSGDAAEEPATDNPHDREADELRSRDTQAVIDRLNEDTEAEPASHRQPNDRPGRNRGRVVDQPRPSTR